MDFHPYMFMTLLSSIDPSNKIYCSILLGILYIISKIFPFCEIKEELINYFKNNDKMVKKLYPSYVIPVVRGSNSSATKPIYSDTFLAIIYNAEQNVKKLQTSTTEIMTSNRDLNVSIFDDSSKDKSLNTSFINLPINNKKVIIFDDIYFELNDIKTKETPEDDNKKTPVVSGFTKYVITISTHKKMDYLDNFVDRCLKVYIASKNKNIDDKLKIYELDSFETSENVIESIFSVHLSEHNKDLKTNIFFEDKQKLINYINPFIYNPDEIVNIGEEKYKRVGFTFKAGLLFHGYPGCGKTSTIKAILKYTNRHGININLSKITSCKQLEHVFRKRIFNGVELSGKQLCYILEDCDATENNFILSRNDNDVDKRVSGEMSDFAKFVEFSSTTVKNVKSDQLNLSCFLNILDGIIELHGIMIILTSNFPERIDEALIRPGRIDYRHEFKKASHNTVVQMLKFKYELSDEGVIKHLSDFNIRDEILSPAKIQTICFENNNIEDCKRELLYAAQNI